MASNVETLIEQGKRALNEGNHPDAQEFLIRATELDQTNVDAWLWLASAVDNDEEKRICLENVLTLDPDNADAKRLLAELDRPAAASGDGDDDVFSSIFDDEPDAETPSDDDDAPFASPFSSTFTDDEGGDSFSSGGPFSASNFSVPETTETIPPAPPADEPEPTADESGFEASTPPDVLAAPEAPEAPELDDVPADDEGYDDYTDIYGGYDEYDAYDDEEIDHLSLLPDDIKPTRLPGADEKVGAGLVAGIIVVSLLNIAAAAALVFQFIG